MYVSQGPSAAALALGTIRTELENIPVLKGDRVTALRHLATITDKTVVTLDGHRDPVAVAYAILVEAIPCADFERAELFAQAIKQTMAEQFTALLPALRGTLEILRPVKVDAVMGSVSTAFVKHSPMLTLMAGMRCNDEKAPPLHKKMIDTVANQLLTSMVIYQLGVHKVSPTEVFTHITGVYPEVKFDDKPLPLVNPVRCGNQYFGSVLTVFEANIGYFRRQRMIRDADLTYLEDLFVEEQFRFQILFSKQYPVRCCKFLIQDAIGDWVRKVIVERSFCRVGYPVCQLNPDETVEHAVTREMQIIDSAWRDIEGVYLVKIAKESPDRWINLITYFKDSMQRSKLEFVVRRYGFEHMTPAMFMEDVLAELDRAYDDVATGKSDDHED